MERAMASTQDYNYSRIPVNTPTTATPTYSANDMESTCLMSRGQNPQRNDNRSRTPSPSATKRVENKTELQEVAHSQSHGQRPDGRPGFGWWLETASALVALSLVAVIVAILLYMDGRSTKEWAF